MDKITILSMNNIIKVSTEKINFFEGLIFKLLKRT